MTKEEKIAEAYGEYWNDIKGVTQQAIISQNGWAVTPVWKNIKGISYDWKSEFIGFMRRPVSIRNIEINNGWIKIENESDLPEYGYYEVIERKTGNISRATLENEFGVKRLLMHYSHYQKIKEIPKPIY